MMLTTYLKNDKKALSKAITKVAGFTEGLTTKKKKSKKVVQKKKTAKITVNKSEYSKKILLGIAGINIASFVLIMLTMVLNLNIISELLLNLLIVAVQLSSLILVVVMYHWFLENQTKRRTRTYRKVAAK